jgi:hypothetical protein
LVEAFGSCGPHEAFGPRVGSRGGPEARCRRKSARRHRLDERHPLTDAAFARVIAGVHVLGYPVREGGLGDEQAVRTLMLLVRTARWLNEIVLLNLDPPIAIDGLSPDVAAVRRREAALPADQDRGRPRHDPRRRAVRRDHPPAAAPMRNRIRSPRVVLR